MSKSVFVLSILATLASACGTHSNAGRGALSPEIEAEQVRLYDRAVKAGMASYQRELEAAAEGAYPSRQAALAMARSLGCESRLTIHLRQALAREGLSMDDLFHFNAHHPGYADSQRPFFRERSEHWDALVEAIATAQVDGMENEAVLTARVGDAGNDG